MMTGLYLPPVVTGERHMQTLNGSVRYGLAVLCLAATMSSVRPTEAASRTSDSDLAAWCDATMSTIMAEHAVPGASLAVVMDGEMALAGGYGYADLHAGTPVDADTTLFRVASITKLFTWTAVMQQVERGALYLDTDINAYLTGFQIPDTFPQPITLSHLMAHTAGFEDRGFETLALAGDPVAPLGRYLAEHIPARVRPPGEVSTYSNYGAALAGHIVAQEAGTTYEDYVEREILQPLVMAHSSAQQPVPAGLAGNEAQGYLYRAGEHRPAPAVVERMAPAGAISASAADMARFMLAQLNSGVWSGGRVLDAATVREMQAQSFSHHPSLPGWAHGFQEMDINGRRVLFHDGSLQGFTSVLLISPADGLGLFLVANGGSGGALDDFLQRFFDRYYPGAMGLPEDAALPSGDPPVAGWYQTARRPHTTIEVLSRQVYVAEAETPRVGALTFLGRKWTHVAPLLYQSPDGDLLAFLANEDGRVTGAALGGLALDRMGWPDLPRVRVVAALMCLVLILSGALAWPLDVVIRRRRYLPPIERSAAAARWLGGAASALVTLYLGILLTGLAHVSLIYGVPVWLRVWSYVSYAIVALAVASAVVAAVAWIVRLWSFAARLHYTLVSLGLLGLVALMAVYNAVGSHWG